MALRGIALSCLVFLLSLISFAEMAISQEPCEYVMRVKTGVVPGAGTNSAISLTLKDTSGDGFTIDNLEDWGIMGSRHDYFELGNRDFFGGRNTCYRICSITITSNGQGSNPGWFLDYVRVTLQGSTVFEDILFPVDQWLAIDEPPHSLQAKRDLCLT